jgi:hypothetical protein
MPLSASEMTAQSMHEQTVLARVACFRCLTSAHVQDFVIDRPDRNPHAREVATQRLIDRLRRRGLIAATPRLVGGPGGGSARVVYSLTDAGYRMAHALDPSRPARRPPPRTTLFIEHALMTADVALAFLRSARAHSEQHVTDWEPDWAAAERLGSLALVPDGHVTYATREWQISAFVEVDLATERPRRFGEKIAKYLAAYRSGTWRKGMSAWPLLLTITPNAGRATELRRCTEELLERERQAGRTANAAEFDFTPLAELQGANGPLGGIWQVAGKPGLHPLIPPDEHDSSALA